MEKVLLKKFKNNVLCKGQSLFELLLAIGVSAIVIVVLVALVNNALQAAAYSRNQTLAGRHAESATEWLRTQRDTRIDTFLTNAGTPPSSWCLKDVSLSDSSWNQHSACSSTDYITGTPFVRQVDFSVDSNGGGIGKTVVTATVEVMWSDSKGDHTVNSSTQFTDWRQR